MVNFGLEPKMEKNLHQKVDGNCPGASKRSRPVQVPCGHVSPGIAPLRRSVPLRTRRDLHADPGALSGRAFDPKRPAQARDALAHRLQAEVSGEGALRIEALAIVANFQEEVTCILP